MSLNLYEFAGNVTDDSSSQEILEQPSNSSQKDDATTEPATSPEGDSAGTDTPFDQNASDSSAPSPEPAIGIEGEETVGGNLESKPSKKGLVSDGVIGEVEADAPRHRDNESMLDNSVGRTEDDTPQDSANFSKMSGDAESLQVLSPHLPQIRSNEDVRHSTEKSPLLDIWLLDPVQGIITADESYARSALLPLTVRITLKT